MVTLLANKPPTPKPAITLDKEAPNGTTHVGKTTPFKEQIDSFLEEEDVELVNPRDDEPTV